MKTRGLIVLAMFALAVTLLSITQAPFPAGAQTPVPTPAPQPVPPPQAAPEPAMAVAVPPPANVQQASTLPQLIARLKQLREQEKDLVNQINKVIADQRQLLQDAEQDLRQLGIGVKRIPVADFEKKDDVKKQR